mmetsp:Transcript_34815/g.84135  ORF Transcript_34815/g.84135 Transcript_34815/m.84135 type:complete len:544 (-) Transcript_34815:15-1646(-)
MVRQMYHHNALLLCLAIAASMHPSSWSSLGASAFQIKASVSVPQTSYLAGDGKHKKVGQQRDAEIGRLITEKLDRIVAGYQTHGDKMKRTLEMQLELSDKVEKCFIGDGTHSDQNDGSLLLSAKLQEKQHLIEECLGVNYHVVRRLLATADVDDDDHYGKHIFHTIDFVPSAAAESNGEHDDLGQLMGNGGVVEKEGEVTKETDGYDTALQVIHHTSRDWTAGSASCRDATIGWIVRAIVEYSSGNKGRGHHALNANNPLRVLVPGAGLGRLAYDISTCDDLTKRGGGVNVDANDSSVTMIFAARRVLRMLQEQRETDGRPVQSTIFPFLSDPQINEIDATKRFEMEMFPDIDAVHSYTRHRELKGGMQPNLSFTVGDFVSTYSQHAKQNQYDVIATSFFIDTATNIYEYVFIMKHLLDNDSVESPAIWVNCGPVQWHLCALLRPTVDELKGILEAAGFELLSWEIADEAVAYRHPDDMGGSGLQARYTRSEAYRPLRFIARLNNDDRSTAGGGVNGNIADLPLRVQYSEYLNEVANGKIKMS